MINHLWDAYQSTALGDLRDYLDNTHTKDVRTDIANMLADNADVGFLTYVRDQLNDFIEYKDKGPKENKS